MKLICVSVLFACVQFFPFTSFAQSNLQTDLPLAYLVKAPAETAGKPLIVFLHGYGSNAADLFELKSDLPSDVTVISAQAPAVVGSAGGRASAGTGAEVLSPSVTSGEALQTRSRGASGFQWFPVKIVGGEFDVDMKEINASTEQIKDFVAKAVVKYKTTAEKTVLVGFSQGGIMAYEVGLRNPKAVGAIVALSGRMTPDLVKHLKTNKDLGRLKVFIGHGTADRTLLLSGAVEARKAIDATSIKAEFHAYPSLTHGINPEEMKDLRSFLTKLPR